MRQKLNSIQWCLGCGDFIILSCLRNVLKELGIPKEKVVIVSGIGCSGKIAHYIDAYASETLHGRSLPFATGVKMANPDLIVIAIGGDGDWYGIGLGHFLHACRRNVDITYLVLNNGNYALTTGQTSPTTPLGAKTRSTPLGNPIPPIDPTALAGASGCKFSKNVQDKDVRGLSALIKEAILFPGFSHIDIIQSCPSWKKW